MSQFERDINLAIQQSLEEERKKQEALNQGQNTNQANVTPGNSKVTATETSKKTLFYFKQAFLFLL
jgi:hypothetical protein